MKAVVFQELHGLFFSRRTCVFCDFCLRGAAFSATMGTSLRPRLKLGLLTQAPSIEAFQTLPLAGIRTASHVRTSLGLA